jgi:hypothetical protein
MFSFKGMPASDLDSQDAPRDLAARVSELELSVATLQVTAVDFATLFVCKGCCCLDFIGQAERVNLLRAHRDIQVECSARIDAATKKVSRYQKEL